MRVSVLVLITALTLAAFGQEKEAPKYDPFADPYERLARNAEEAAKEKKYSELKAAAEELTELSREMSEEIAAGNKDIVSAKVLQNLDRAEKLIKTMRDKAR